MTIDKFNFAGKKAFVRVDFNVPLDENFNITDDTRIRAALPTLKKILSDGGSVIIGSHLGRPKGVADKFSLKHIVKHVSELLGVEVQFANDCMGEEAAVKAAALQPGEALLLENLRFYAEEEGKPRGLAEDATDEEKAAAKKAVKESQKEFTKKLASYADCYVNDAFGTAHRAHASTALIAKYFDKDHKMFGYLMEKEVKAVDKILNDIQRPFTAIMGGSKVSSKIEIIENLLNKVDNLIITGGMTYTFTKAQGGHIGLSIVEDDKLDLALELMKKAKEKGVNLVLAVDAKIADSFSNDANTKFCAVNEIPDGWEGLDIGPKSEEMFAEVIKNSKTILWNGPTGVFEFENFTHGSRTVGEAIVEATKNGAFSLVGGGDSVACVNKFGLANGVSYVSTGGGGMILTDDEELAKRAKHITTTAKLPHRWEYRHDYTAYNYRLTNLAAALGCGQIEQLDFFIQEKRKLVEKYKAYFADQAEITFFTEPEDCRSNYWLNAVILKDRNARDEFLQYTNDHGIMTRPIWVLSNKLDMYRGCQCGDLSDAEWLEDRVVNIPSSVIIKDYYKKISDPQFNPYHNLV